MQTTGMLCSFLDPLCCLCAGVYLGLCVDQCERWNVSPPLLIGVNHDDQLVTGDNLLNLKINIFNITQTKVPCLLTSNRNNHLTCTSSQSSYGLSTVIPNDLIFVNPFTTE